MRTEVKKNGYKQPTEIAEDKLLKQDFGGSGVSPELFVSPGRDVNDDPLKLFMRTFIVSRDEAVAIARLYSKAVRTGCDMAVKDLIAFLALKAAIGGRSTLFCLQGMTNAISPEVLLESSNLNKGKKTIFGRFAGMKNKKNEVGVDQAGQM